MRRLAHPPGCTCLACYMWRYRHIEEERPAGERSRLARRRRDRLLENNARHQDVWRDRHRAQHKLSRSLRKLIKHFFKYLNDTGQEDALTFFKGRRQAALKSLEQSFGDTKLPLRIYYRTIPNQCHAYAVCCQDEEQSEPHIFRLCAIFLTQNALPIANLFPIVNHPELSDFVQEWCADFDPSFEGDGFIPFFPSSLYPDETAETAPVYRQTSSYRDFSLEDRLVFVSKQQEGENNRNLQ